MHTDRCICLLAAVIFPFGAAAIEIATGKMLGPGYETRSFYVREGSGMWQKTYTGKAFRPEAAGRLMNLRIAQGLFDDEWLTEFPFDPEENTNRLIRALDDYKSHGVMAISVSLQAGNAGYNIEFQGIKRAMMVRPGPGKGTLTSAFLPDGSLKEAWMNRLLRLVKELDRRGMVLDLMYFYSGQGEVLQNPEAIRRAARNATDWLIDHDCRNVIVEIANEYNVNGFDRDRYIPLDMGTLIIHGNGRSPEQKRRGVPPLVADAAAPGPIYMNEDNSGRETTPETLEKELASCDAVFSAGGSWGYMPWRQTQMFPFRFYQPAKSASVTAGMPPDERDPAYFRAVLDHIQHLVMRAP
jgi:hypothetical protein